MSVAEQSNGSRFYEADGRPRFAELAHAALMNAHAAPLREEALRWMRSAQVNAQLAQIAALEDLARSNRQLAASQGRLADEMAARRGVS